MSEYAQHTERWWSGNQSWHYQSLGDIRSNRPEIAGVRTRVTIRRNAYDEQSTLLVEVFDPVNLKWNSVVRWALTKECACYHVSYVQTIPDIELFRTDRDALLAEALYILG